MGCPLSTGTEISIGQNDHPWMATGAKEVYEGTENPGPALKDPLEFFTAKQVALLRMLAGRAEQRRPGAGRSRSS